MKTKIVSVLLCLMFGIPFLAMGIFAGILPAAEIVGGWHKARNWQPVPAKIIHTFLDTRRNKKTTTYRVSARYEYTYQDRSYIATRIGFGDGDADNIGTWHEDWHAYLQQLKSDGQSIGVWVNPNNPAEAVIERSIRWPLLLFTMPFAILFTAVGLAAFLVLWKTLHAPAGQLNKPALADNPQIIRSDARVTALSMGMFAFFWNVLAFPIAGLLLVDGRPLGPAFLLILFFPGVGIYLLIIAVRAAQAWRRAGDVLLSLSPPQPRIGQKVGGEIRFGKAETAVGDYELTLICERVDRRNKNMHHHVHWQDKRSVRRIGDVLQFRFAVPASMPPSEPRSAQYFRWLLRLEAQEESLLLNFELVLRSD